MHHEKVYVNGIPTYGIEVKIENEAFTVVGSGCRQNLKFVFSQKVFFFWQNTLRKCTKLRAACAEQLFVLFTPIISLYCRRLIVFGSRGGGVILRIIK